MDNNSLVICNICHKYMNCPRILPCAHSFCLQCLESLATSKEPLKCPKCQMAFETPQGGLKELKRNKFIEQLRSLREKITMCNICEQNEAVKFCAECSFNYCSTCLEIHLKIPVARIHQLQSPTSTEAESKVNNYKACTEHSELMTLLCETCKSPMCSHCLTLNHSNHKFLHLSDYFNSIKKVLKLKEEALQSVVKNLRSSEEIIRGNQMKALKLKKEVNQRGEDVKQMIDSIVISLNQTIDDELKQQQQIANNILEDLKRIERDLIKDIADLKSFSCSNIIELNTKAMNQDVGSMNIQKYSANLCLSFYSNKDIVNEKKVFGNLCKEPLGKLLSEEKYLSNAESITVYKGELHSVMKNHRGSLEIKKHSKVHERKTNVQFHKPLAMVGNLLVLDGSYFISGISDKGHQYILNAVQNGDEWELYQVFEHPPIPDKSKRILNLPRISKSTCGNIVVNIFSKILIVSPTGVVMKRINFALIIQDVLQLYESCFLVCAEDDVCISYNNGSIIQKISYRSCFSNASDSKTSLRIARDSNNNIYVYKRDFNKILVTNSKFDLKLYFEVKHPLREILCNEEDNLIVALCEDRSVLTYTLNAL